ncbi:hypothetical protein C7M84_003122 [Penaeus vannamei]|uniref:Uncharacterized protein n=1 Tax=Penaeus vannamei TaxID=6689 RepID=A0A3R7PVD6_PENVA|nr:hypothetical protein C7M84_003122 [Penaeus vannamei]
MPFSFQPASDRNPLFSKFFSDSEVGFYGFNILAPCGLIRGVPGSSHLPPLHYGPLSDGASPPGLLSARPPVTSEGLVRVAFKQVKVKATYQVRGSAGGFFTFREGGDLTLAVPTVFLTSRLNVTLPGFSDSSRRRLIPRHGRVKVLWVHSDVSIANTKLTLEPGAYPPEWVRQQVQTKLEELSSDLSHGHGAVRLLLRRWGKLLKRLVHRTARSLVK